MQKVAQVLLTILLTLNILYVVSGIVFYPVRSIDTVGIWMLKAKAIAFERGVPFGFLRSSAYAYAHQQYPLLLPAVLALTGTLFGGVDGKAPLLLSSLAYACILLIAYVVFRKKLSTIQSLFFVYLYSGFPPLLGQAGRGHAGNADIYIVLCAWALIFLYTRKRTHIVLPVLIVWVASQIKTEGVFLAATLLMFLEGTLTIRVTWTLISLIPFVLWQEFVRIANIPSDIGYRIPPVSEAVSSVFTIVRSAVSQVLEVRQWFTFWILATAALVSPLRKKHGGMMKFYAAAGLMSCLFFASYMFATLEIEEYLSSSLDRVFLQLSPWVFYPTSVWVSHVFKKHG